MSASHPWSFGSDVPTHQLHDRPGSRPSDREAALAAVEALVHRLRIGAWARSIAAADQMLAEAQAVREGLAAHVIEMEGPGGLMECVGNDCPRLGSRIVRLNREHHAVRTTLAEIEAMLEAQRRGIGHPQAVRDKARQLLALMRHHQDASNSLVLEAYTSDIGIGD